jgi:hypothetical protein
VIHNTDDCITSPGRREIRAGHIDVLPDSGGAADPALRLPPDFGKNT